MKKKAETSFNTDLRRKAEARLIERQQEAREIPEANLDVRRLVHELEVHQIELEMQNDELLQARNELEWTLKMYVELYAFAPAGYFTLTANGTIHRANLTGANLLGVRLSDLVDKRFGVFISAETRAVFNKFLDKVFNSKSKEYCEVMLDRQDSTPLWVSIVGTCETTETSSKLCYAIVSDISERKLAEENLIHLSTHDQLTELYNHSFFFEKLAQLEHGREFPISIVVADVDHLKIVNDEWGHLAGDALLKRVAHILTSAFRVEDTLARIGGDEFAVLLPSTDANTAQIVLRRVQQVLDENNAAHGGPPIHISLGVATAETRTPLAEVLKTADANMYITKRGNAASWKVVGD